MSPIAPHQWQKVGKALIYSVCSGFIGGFALQLTGYIQSGGTDVSHAVISAVVVGGIVGGINSLAVTVKQLFTPVE